MNGRTATLILLVVCVVLAFLLLMGTIKTVIASVVFAAALVVLGLASGGFRNRPSPGN